MKDSPALEAMNVWLMELGNEGRSPRTIQAYESEVLTTLEFAADELGLNAHELSLGSVTRDLLVAAIANFRVGPDPRYTLNPEQAPGERSPARVARRVAAIKVFFKWCYATGRLTRDPAALLKTPRKTKRLPKALEAESARLVMSGSGPSRWPERDLLMVVLALTTGLRLEEMATLKLDSLTGDLPDYITVIGKGNKERRLPLAPVAQDCIARYLPTRTHRLRKLGLEAKTLFVSSRPRRVGTDREGQPRMSVEATKSAVAYVIDRILRQAGARRPGSRVHVLRHTFATLGLRPDPVTGMPAYNLRQLQTALGHANLATIQVYTEVSDAELVTAVQAHPLAQRRDG